jgi:hypothetical protein
VLDRSQRLTATLLGSLLVAAGIVAEFLLVALLGLNCGGTDTAPRSTAPMCDGADLEVVWLGCAFGMVGVPLAGTIATALSGRRGWLIGAAAVFALTLMAIVLAVRAWA